MQEKRRHPRVTLNVKVRCEMKGKPALAGTIVDLSVGGVFIEAESAPPFATEVVVVGDFPGNPGMKLPAVVRWTKPGGFGVQFGLLGARETHLLTTLVQRPKG